MVEIRLDQKENGNTYQGTNEIVKIAKSNYANKLFDKIVYEIIYDGTYQSSIFGWWRYGYLFYLYFKLNKSQTVFIFYPANDLDIVNQVETYYASKNPDTILVVGFKTRHYTRYYTYSKLKSKSSWTGFPSGEFYSRKLSQKLKDEDNRVNRIKFYNTGETYKNCNKTSSNVKDSSSLKYCYNAKHQNRYDDHLLTKEQIFKYEKGIDVHDRYFESVHGKYYDDVCVYRTHEDHSQVLLLEFINGPNKTYFVRQDKHGHYWISKPISDPNSELKKIDDEYRNKLAYLIGRKGIYNGVKVVKPNHPSFDQYKHTPDGELQNKTVYLLYSGKKLTLTGQSSYLGNHKLDRLDNKKFCEVNVFFVQSNNDQSPVFIQLTETSGTKTYWLQKINPNGLLWKQVTDPQLSEVITYRLELKSTGSYSNNSIQLYELPDGSFKAYSHKVHSSFDEKKSFITYESNLLLLQSINDIPKDQRLDNIQEKKLSSVSVYFTKDETGGPPFYLQLTEQPKNKNYYLLKVDKEGLLWKQVDNESGKISIPQNREKILKEAEYYTKKSIVILVNENKNSYPVNIIDNSSNDVTNQFPSKDKKITVEEQKCTNFSGYKLYMQKLPNIDRPTKENNPLSGVTGYRFLIGSSDDYLLNVYPHFQIIPYDESGSSREYFTYDSNIPSSENTSEVYLFFHSNHNLPLILKFGSTYYKPNSFDDYFRKWRQISGFRLYDFCESRNKNEIEKELNSISTSLNQINIKNTDNEGYGLFDNSEVIRPKGFDGKLIDVKNEDKDGLFKNMNHTPTNKSTISKLKYGTKELNEDSGRKINIGNNKTVSVYYYKSDYKYQYPLLIYLSGDNRNEFFYERETSNNNVNWRKVELSYDLKNNNQKIANKINSIHYTIGKSIIVRVDHQDKGGRGSYPVKLVQNGGSNTVPEAVGDNKNITVKKDQCTSSKAPLTGYTCFTHEIPKDIGSTSHYISGLKLYICDTIYLKTFEKGGSLQLPIYYQSGKNEVKVYFYGDTSGNPPVDKVPLLVEYNSLYFKPSSREGYFTKWVKTDVNTSDQVPRGDSIVPKTLQQVLDDVNKDLNQIQLEQTGDTSTGGDKYGIKEPEPSESVNCADQTSIKRFCERVTVTRDGQSHKDYYLIVTHITNNKGPIGIFMHGNQLIDGIKTEDVTKTCNRVDVYYLNSDTTYSKPLLVCITTQNKEPVSGCTKKWFSRLGVDPTKWNNADGENKYGDEGKIKSELDQINARMSNYLYLNIDKQGEYPGYVQKGSDGEKKYSIGNITSSASYGDSYKVDHYRHYQHFLSKYYTHNKVEIVSQLRLDTQDPTLQVRLDIFNNYSLGLCEKDGISTLTTPLTYGNEQADRGEDFNPYVYFFESSTGIEDKVPLLLKFGNGYFGPVDKENFFKSWKQYDLNEHTDLRTDSEKIKALLNQITRKLNEIKLDQTGNGATYGDITTSDRSNPLDAKPRVSVTRNTGSKDYNAVTHSTAKTGSIGYVYYSGSELKVFEDLKGGAGKKWSQAIELEMSQESTRTAIYNELTAYYHKTDNLCKTPLVIKITGPNVGGVRLQDLYYERHDNKELPINWKKVTETSSLNRYEGLVQKLTELHYMVGKSVKMHIEKNDQPSSGYIAKLVKNDEASTPDNGGGVRVKVSKDNCKPVTSYTCIKHTVDINRDIESQVGGLRFYLGDKEVETLKNQGGSFKVPIYYDNNKKYVHVYFHSTGEKMDTVPLMFRYNSQCFKPYSKADYFTKWVYDPSINEKSHPKVTDLNKIDTMLNEINLKNTGNGRGGDTQQYGLDKPPGAGQLTGIDTNRITATRTSGVKFLQVTHSTINNLGIGKVMFEGTEVTENQGGQKNLSDAVKEEPGLVATSINEVTAYYHKDDEGFTTPLMLGFGRTGEDGPDTSTPTLSVFYERVDSNKPPTKWKRVRHLDTGEQNITEKLEEIRYNIGRSVVINIEKQEKGGGVSEEYDVNLVDNSGSSRTSPQSIKEFNHKIQVKKGENCFTSNQEFVPQSTQKYNCYTHTIPDLTKASDHPLIGGLKFYVCNNNQYLPTYGKDGYPLEPIYYDNKQTTVTVYFYSSGHGPPPSGVDSVSTQTQSTVDKVPLLVEYDKKYYRPKDRLSYFTSWVLTEVQESTEGDSGQGKPIKEVLDWINKDMNAIDLLQTNQGYGLIKPSGTNCPCTSIANFCDRISVKREPVTQNTQAQGDAEPAPGPTLFLRVTHTTTNKASIGNIYHGSQVITAIKTTEVEGCNQVSVYYDATDTHYQTPLLICLCQQTGGEVRNEVQPSNNCKKWYKRKGIDINDWVEEGDTNKYGSDDKIQSELKSIQQLFKDYLYLEIENKSGYQPSVQAKTGGKVKVQNVGEGTDEKNKIKVTDAGSGEGAQVQVPKEYKRHTHGLKAFYNGAKKEINTALKKTQGQTQHGQSDSENQIQESSGQDPELHLRLQIAGQDLTLVGTEGTNIAPPLEYKPTDTDSGTDASKNDPIVFFYGKGGGSTGSDPDTVPLMFRFGTTYFGPKDRHSYFQGWQEYKIDGTDGAQTKDDIKKKLDDINRQLNQIDLTQTGTGSSRTSTEYGLEKGSANLTGNFQTKRIKVTHQDHFGKGYKTVTHTTANGYNIGNIKDLGSCKFDNTHTKQLTSKTHNEAVAVYAGQTTPLSGNPSLVLIAESKGATSTVHGYYIINECTSGSKSYEFKTVKSGFTVDDITKKESIKDNTDLLKILQRIGIIKEDVQVPVAPQTPHVSDSLPVQEDSHDAEEDDDDNSLGAGDGGNGHGLGDSGGEDAGAKGGPGKPGPAGPKGEPGNNTIAQQQESQVQEQHIEQQQQETPVQNSHTMTSDHTTTRRNEGQELQRTGGGVDGGLNRGGAGPGRPGERGTKGENGKDARPGSSSSVGETTSAQSSPEGGLTAQKILDFLDTHKTEVSAGGGGVAGVGVIATVGAVVYKK